jgi:hypothetical protein
MKYSSIILIVCLLMTSCKERKNTTDVFTLETEAAQTSENTIFKMGFKTDSTSTGPLDNSAFVLKVNETLPPLLVTAHHTVAGIGNDQHLHWNEIADNQKNAWAWSMNDSTVNFKVGESLPIRNAETMKLDIAAFLLINNDVPYLKPSKTAAQIGDTIYLMSKIVFENKTTLKNRGVIRYVADSVVVYELTDFHMARIMSGTSGSCVVDNNGAVVSNSYAGFTIPNDQVRKEIALQFPLLNKIKTTKGKTYGVGVPIALIERSLVQAFQQRK